MVPKGWELQVLDNLCSKIAVGLAISVTPYMKEKGVKLIRNQNIKRNRFDDSSIVYLDEDFAEQNKTKQVRAGDVIAVRTGSNIGEACSVPPEFHGALTFTTLIARPEAELLNSEFLCLHINSEKGVSEVNRLMAGGGKPNLNSGELKNYQILLPPLSEQRKIAQILSSWDKAITTTERLLSNRQQQKKALMQRLLTGKQRFAGLEGEWCITTLGEVFSKITNGLTYDAKATEGLPVTRIETISTGVVNYVKVGWAPANENTKRFRLQYGDILYSHINSLEHIGRVAFYREEYPLYHGMNLLLLRPNDKVIPEFVYYVLNSQIGKRYAKLYAKAAVNQASISTTEIKTFKIKIPNKNEQQKIASVLSAADAEITTIQNQLDNLKQQKKALMQQLLTGKRRVKVDSPALATQ